MPDRLTDRQRIEIALPALILSSIVRDVRAHETDPSTTAMCDEVVDALDSDIEVTLDGLGTRTNQVRRRMIKARDRATKAMYCEEFAAVVLGFRLLVERLSAEGYIMLVEGSLFDQAWTRFANAVESSPEAGALDTPDVRGRADRVYKAVRRALSGLGLYR